MEERRKLKSSANAAGKDLKGVIREANGVKDFPPPSTPMFHRGNGTPAPRPAITLVTTSRERKVARPMQ
ncbi:hypothetical protein K0M31_003597 [Melipona bicolor]|uniref:Uncharacterized protein n=1 Tax=Melipona bicolor TaxID=60889 RepID=A0AA40KPN5_9HYME|nr:hypothetical protein K0M31_003597 [Melipona bicolor]